jgi:hypothetical protein
MSTPFDRQFGHPWTVEIMTSPIDKVVAERFRANGWKVLDKGWPDLLVYDYSARFMAIELKRGSDQLRPDQETMQTIFQSVFGIPFYVAREDLVEDLLKIQPMDEIIPVVCAPELSMESLEIENEILRNRIEELAIQVQRLHG